MKTKTFLLLCLFMGIGLIRLFAQDTKSYVTKDWPVAFGEWGTEVYCDGVLVDIIVGSGTAHWVDHVSNGDWKFSIASVKGEGVSLLTGELFTFSEQDKFWTPKPKMFSSHTNLKGNKGTLYNISFERNMLDGTVVVKNATCTGNSK